MFEGSEEDRVFTIALSKMADAFFKTNHIFNLMFKFIKEEGFYILSIQELEEYRNSKHFKVNGKQSYYRKKKMTINLQRFFQWYINYCDSELKGKNYKDKAIVQQVFQTHISVRQQPEFFRYHLLISKRYVEELQNYISIVTIEVYRHTITALLIDLEELICNYEVKVKKSIKSVSLNTWRRKDLSPTDIFVAAKTMFWIENMRRIEDIYLRDFKPVVMFQIRQLLEIYGKNLLGIDEIQDKNGKPSKKFTQVAWEVISNEMKSKKSRITVAFDLYGILVINRWANDFVHSTFLYSQYLQFFALQITSSLFKQAPQSVLTFDKQRRLKFNIADIRIVNYESLKIDIEKYLQNKLQGTKVSWMKPEQAGAYIITL